MNSIASYKIITKINEGATTAVYKAYQTTLDRVVLLKVLHTHLTQEEDLVARFQREAKACARIKHENIVDVFDYGFHQGIHYIAMEFVEGINLNKLLNKNIPLPFDLIVFIALELLKGLDFAHAKKVYHRDIKPANIILSYDGAVKISDFGLALIAEVDSVTVQGTILGSPAYMSPEQISGETIDARSDIFSAGATIYEMITNEQAFSGTTHSECLNKVLNKQPPKIEKLRPDCPPELIRIVKKMLIKNRTRRYRSCNLVIEDLSRFANQKQYDLSRNNLKTFLQSLEGRQPTQRKAITSKKVNKKVYLFPIAIIFFSLIMLSIYYYHTNNKIAAPEIDQNYSQQDTIKQSVTPGHDTLSQELNKVPISGIFAEPNNYRVKHEETMPAKPVKSRDIEQPNKTEEKGLLIIRCAPWAKILLDNNYLATIYEYDSLSLSLDEGFHKLTLINPEFSPYDTGFKEIRITGGQTTRLKISFLDLIEAGILKIQVEPWAEVYIDNESKGITPLPPIVIKKGTHTLSLKHPDLGQLKKKVFVKVGETTDLKINLTQIRK